MVITTQNMQPKHGETLRVIRIARISTLNQDERSLADQLALLQNQVDSMFEGEIEYTDLATQGSGEKLDRQELQQLEEMIETGSYDLVIAEDLARICRRVYAIIICELCEDSETRLIAINDRVDTADDGWRDGAVLSSWHHERSNKDTSNRIKRSLRNRFQNGAILSDPGPFYVVPPNANSIDDILKNAESIKVVETGIAMLESGSNYSEIADWLNKIGFAVGGNSKKIQWNGKLVKERFLDSRLKGVEEWNNKKSVRDNKTGQRRSKNAAPEELLRRNVPHMAFLESARFDRLKEHLQKKNAHSHRSDNRKTDPLLGRPKKRTPFPGQSLYCGICGRKFVFGGHGQKAHLMCDGARQYHCWNSITVDGPLAASKISAAVFHEYEKLEEFDDTFCRFINEEADRADEGRHVEIQRIETEIRRCEAEIENYLSYIAGGKSSMVRDRLGLAETRFTELQVELHRLNAIPSKTIEIPSAEKLKLLAEEALGGDLPFSWEFNRIMKSLTSRIVVFPYRLIDGGHLYLRAKFRLHIGGLCEEERSREILKEPLEKVVSVNLWEPPQRELFRDSVVRLREGMTEKKVAETLGITHTAAQRAAQLQRLMEEKGTTDPYVAILEPPVDYTKLRRHKHPRYNFEPLADAGSY